MTVVGWMFLVYFLLGSFWFWFYGFLNRLSVRNILAFCIGYFFLVHVITFKLFNKEVLGDSSTLDNDDINTKIVRCLFGFDAWNVYLDKFNRNK